MNDEEIKIPKIVHYCWFGKNKKTRKFKKCLKSWKKHLPDYRIIEWNEDNFNIVNSIQYVKDAYKNKKYAFVSDYVRLYALKKMGGIYMDTDVEVLKNYNNLLHYSSFWGFEDDKYMASCVIGANSDDILLDKFFHHYENVSFLNKDGSLNQKTNTQVLTEILNDMGITMNGQKQFINGNIAIFPKIYFSPYDYKNGDNFICQQSYAIHHFSQSWIPWYIRYRRILKTKIMKIFGKEIVEKLIKNKAVDKK